LKAELLYEAGCLLAEGPHWHEERNSVFWVDIEGKKLFELSFESSQVKAHPMPARVTTVVQDKEGNLILGLQGGIASFDLKTETLTWLLDIEKEYPNHRCNDGKCDPEGRLWIGVMDENCTEGQGSLYCIEPDFSLQKKMEHLTIPNGIVWSPGKEKMYHIDSATGSVKSYFFERATGKIAFEKIAIQIPTELGEPDGMCIDEEGMVWIAHWGGFGIYRWNPQTGERLCKIELPVPLASSCAFWGKNLNQLVITTASTKLNKEEKKQYPLSGSLFIASPGVKGIAPGKFGKQ
jgi:sugar lactone lactonase YvrE